MTPDIGEFCHNEVGQLILEGDVVINGDRDIKQLVLLLDYLLQAVSTRE